MERVFLKTTVQLISFFVFSVRSLQLKAACALLVGNVGSRCMLMGCRNVVCYEVDVLVFDGHRREER